MDVDWWCFSLVLRSFELDLPRGSCWLLLCRSVSFISGGRSSFVLLLLWIGLSSGSAVF